MVFDDLADNGIGVGTDVVDAPTVAVAVIEFLQLLDDCRVVPLVYACRQLMCRPVVEVEALGEHAEDGVPELRAVCLAMRVGAVDTEDHGQRFSADIAALIYGLVGEVAGALVLTEKFIQFSACHFELDAAEFGEAAVALPCLYQPDEGGNMQVDESALAPALTQQVEHLGAALGACQEGGAAEEEVSPADIEEGPGNGVPDVHIGMTVPVDSQETHLEQGRHTVPLHSIAIADGNLDGTVCHPAQRRTQVSVVVALAADHRERQVDSHIAASELTIGKHGFRVVPQSLELAEKDGLQLGNECHEQTVLRHIVRLTQPHYRQRAEQLVALRLHGTRRHHFDFFICIHYCYFYYIYKPLPTGDVQPRCKGINYFGTSNIFLDFSLAVPRIITTFAKNKQDSSDEGCVTMEGR